MFPPTNGAPPRLFQSLSLYEDESAFETPCRYNLKASTFALQCEAKMFEMPADFLFAHPNDR